MKMPFICRQSMISVSIFVELEDEVIGAIEGDRENSKENNRNDAIAAQLLEITEGEKICQMSRDEYE